MRAWLRDQLFGILKKMLATHDGRDILDAALPSGLRASSAFQPDGHLLSESPYADLAAGGQRSTCAADSVFITGRFRSGSTLLWNLFRHVPGCTSYYEPLNERRWFDPQRRGRHVDQTHKQVENYWQEYDGLDELAGLYQEEWIHSDLFLPESAWNPRLKRYIEVLIERAAGLAVLQFNRVDFRLPWLRVTFPRAKIVHLYRHPRDQWLSTLHGDEHFHLDGTIPQFAPLDHFYLLSWGRDLKRTFPFLDERQLGHPYELFYLIWKLSYLFGRQYADISLSFERLVSDPQEELPALLDALGFEMVSPESLLPLIERPRLGRWKEYADGEWFARHEANCERTLADFFAKSPEPHPAAIR